MARVSMSVQVAQVCIARAKQQEPTNGKGIKRDKSCLEFIIGAAAAFQVMAENTSGAAHLEATQTCKSLESTAFMVAVRGHAFLVELTELAEQPK